MDKQKLTIERAKNVKYKSNEYTRVCYMVPKELYLEIANMIEKKLNEHHLKNKNLTYNQRLAMSEEKIEIWKEYGKAMGLDIDKYLDSIKKEAQKELLEKLKAKYKEGYDIDLKFLEGESFILNL